ncbi:hypothetical protein PFC_01695 [Pyrococcus furiosus COM1]|uniref:Protein-glutamine gamma-glutamyltransferase-like C-terminal domain-containing protein n=1 Tax=Pyrococcus furiosus COM1 TaxID=1185654 RepID=I6UXJ0_9EURY|nr:hypothetical protein PFC_01695 [Pyrococcus furiosus COM1]
MIVFFAILVVMGILYGSTTGRVRSAFSSSILSALFLWMSLISLIFLALLLIAFVILVREKDLEARGHLRASLAFLKYWLIVAAALFLYASFYLSKLFKVKEMENITQTTDHVVVPPSFFETPSEATLASVFVYIPIIFFAIIFVLALLSMGRDVNELRKTRQIKRELEAFDKKVDDLGVDAFSDPREAVIEFYRKAVLWLEILGIPYRESWTHWEHAKKVEYKKKAYVELARLFEKAKYAPEKVTMDDARRAYELYKVIKGES